MGREFEPRDQSFSRAASKFSEFCLWQFLRVLNCSQNAVEMTCPFIRQIAGISIAESYTAVRVSNSDRYQNQLQLLRALPILQLGFELLTAPGKLWEVDLSAIASAFHGTEGLISRQTRLLWVEWRCCSLSLFLFNRWHYLWKQNYENILGEIVFPNPVSLKHLTRVLPLMTAKLSQMGKFILNSHTIQRDQMPLSNLFSASTSNAIY